MAFTLDFLIQRFQEEGVFNLVLPFLLIFALTKAILDETPIGRNSDKPPTIIAFVLGMYVTIYSPFAAFLTSMIGGSSIILIGLMMLMLVVWLGLAFTGHSMSEAFDGHVNKIVSALMFIVGVIFVNSGGLIVIGEYSIRIGLWDIIYLILGYQVLVWINNHILFGKPDIEAVKRYAEKCETLARDKYLLESTGKQNTPRYKQIERQLQNYKKDMIKKGVKPEDVEDLINKRGVYLSHGRYGHQPYPRWLNI